MEDYALVTFALRPDFDFSNEDIYVFGELTDWAIKPEAKWSFNHASNYWECSLFLKQGFYNYQYVNMKKGTQVIDETFIEGSHWQTQNDYLVLVYLQEEGSYYDKLIAVEQLNIMK